MGESGDILNAQLCDAVRKDDIEGANHLLEKGASVDARKKSFLNSTVLMIACFQKNKAMVDLLLKRGASINETDDLGWTALMITALSGDEAIFDLLVEHNADVTKKADSGQTVIHYAARHNSKTILNRLLLLPGQCCCPCTCSCAQWGLTVDIDDNGGQTPLFWAALGGHVDCVDVLLVHGANPDHKSENDISPLDIAKKRGHTTVVSMMTEASKLRSHRYGAHTFKAVPKLRQNIALLDGRLCDRDKKIQSLEKEKQESVRSKERFGEEIKKLRSQNEQGVYDPEKVFQAVTRLGCDQWYSLCLLMGYASGQVDDITSRIPSNADKIRAVFNKKINAVGESAATEALLEACRRLPHPINGGVMDILSTPMPSLGSANKK